MKKISYVFAIYFFSMLCFFSPFALTAQTQTSVPLGDNIYRILDIAELRGLCAPLPKVKPYTRHIVINAINEILSSDGEKLSDGEREILSAAKKRLGPASNGLDWGRGTYRAETVTKNGIKTSAELGAGLDITLSGGYYFEGNNAEPGFEFIPKIKLAGDISENFSYGFSISGLVAYANRKDLGEYYVAYEGYIPDPDDHPALDSISSYAQPKAFFPYSYSPKWDATLWYINSVNNSDFRCWPQELSIGYSASAELAGTLFDDAFFYRIGRLSHEYGGMQSGYSLEINGTSQPFAGVEIAASPFSWFSFSAITGALEFYALDNNYGASSKVFQNMFSLSQAELNYKNYFYLGFGSAVVWPKRFELSYLLPLYDKHLTQQAIGDYDNTAQFVNIKGQYPGIFSAWASLFIDEISPGSKMDFLHLDRISYAYQAGVMFNIPRLNFGTLALSYTKIEPYCYSHKSVQTPWYDNEMLEPFANHGMPLGYNLDPNSDELKLVFKFMPAANINAHAQYQMIRHGADNGNSQVDGGSYYSGLPGDADERDNTPALKKYFLEDGAYQWYHIIKAGAVWKAEKMPFELFGEAGVVFSYFTNIKGTANDGSAHPYEIIDTKEYPKSTGVIITLGIRLYP
jgi:hypothetical protein